MDSVTRNEALKAEVRRVLAQECGARGLQSRFLLAVSGGRDSMALLELFFELEFSFAVAHFDHAVRPDSDRDARFVRDYCEARDIAFHSQRGSGLRNDEAGLRQERHAFLERVLLAEAFDWIVTAHHAQDQIETQLMRMLRGCGLKGLGAMAPRRGVFLRPFLNVSPRALESYLESRKVSFREDPSNRDPRYFRNRIRHELLPVLYSLSQSHGGEAKWVERMLRLAEDARFLESGHENTLDRFFADCVVQTPYWSRVRREDFSSLSDGLQARFIARVTKRFKMLDWTRERLEGVKAAIEQGLKNHSLSSDLQLIQSCGWLFFAVPHTPPQFENHGEGRWCCPPLGMTLQISAPHAADVECRFVRPGDRFEGAKLKQRWLEKRVPRPERPFIPVAYSHKQNQLVWVYPETAPWLRVLHIEFPLSVQRDV